MAIPWLDWLRWQLRPLVDRRPLAQRRDAELVKRIAQARAMRGEAVATHEQEAHVQ